MIRRVLRVALIVTSLTLAAAVILAPDQCFWLPMWLANICGCYDVPAGGGGSGAGD